MKLTKPEIQFIDNYLIKNKVKYWDVRLELLDHIVSAVEDKIENEGVSFNEALLEVHRGFGNQLIKSSIADDELWDKGLYQSNIGFKRFAANKQKELGKSIRRDLRNEVVLSFKKVRFYLEFMLLILLCYLLTPLSFGKVAFGVMLVYFFVTCIIIFHSVFNKIDKRSMQLNGVYILGFSLLSIFNLFLQIFAINQEPKNSIAYLFLLIVLVMSYPIIRANIVLYIKCFRSFKINYKFYFK